MVLRGRSLLVAVAAAAAIHGASGCGGSSGGAPTCVTGQERCACYGNGTCNAGLVCRSNRCVSETSGAGGRGGNDATGGTGGAGNAGTIGTGGGIAGAGGDGNGGQSGAAGGGGQTTGVAGAGGVTTGGRGGGGAGGTSTGGGGGVAGTTAGSGGASAGGRGGAGGVAGTTAGSGGTSVGGRGGGGVAGTTAGSGGTSAGGRGGSTAAGGRAFILGPAIASGGPGEIDVFAVGTDGKVHWRQYAAGWSSWQLLFGSESITSDVDVSEVGFSTFDVLGLGAAGNVVHQRFANGTWMAQWEDFSAGEANVTPARYGVATTLTGVTQSSYVSGWAFTTGSNGAIWTRNKNIAGVWGGWSTIQGSVTSAPDAVSRVAATWVVARGAAATDIVINKNATNLDGFGQWSGFTTLPRLAGGASFSHGPCITAWTDSRLDVLAPGGSATSLWHNTSTDGGATWNLPNWEDWGGGPSIVSAPDCVASESGRLDVVVVGADGHVWRRVIAGSLPAWEDLGVY